MPEQLPWLLNTPNPPAEHTHMLGRCGPERDVKLEVMKGDGCARVGQEHSTDPGLESSTPRDNEWRGEDMLRGLWTHCELWLTNECLGLWISASLSHTRSHLSSAYFSTTDCYEPSFISDFILSRNALLVRGNRLVGSALTLHDPRSNPSTLYYTNKSKK